MKTEVYNYLKEDPRFRERANKNKGFANLIMKKYGLEIPHDKREDIISDILSADRHWRRALEDEPSLRGEDYAEGKNLSQEHQINLGYQPMNDIYQKELNKL